MVDGPLAGVRVLDLTQGIAGPYATQLLSDYGAEVLKIERPDGGDPARRIGPFPDDEPHPERSGTFLNLNTGKLSVTLNLRTATGQRILQRLAAEADLVVESFRPGTLERLGLPPARLEELSPAATLVRISNFGQHGPYRDFEADDMLLYAMGEVLQVTGQPDREPVKLALFAPLFLAGGVIAPMALAACLAAERDGVGDLIDVSLMEILAASMDRGGPHLVSYQYSGALTMPKERPARSNAMPRGCYPCKDGYVHVASQLHWWPRLCRVLGRPELADEPRLRDRITEIEAGEEIDALFYPWLLERTKQEAMQAGQAEGYAISALNTMEDVFADPHLRAREFFTELAHPEAGSFEYPGLPFRLFETPGELRRAPLLGEHTSQLLVDRLGYTREDIVILRQRNVV